MLHIHQSTESSNEGNSSNPDSGNSPPNAPISECHAIATNSGLPSEPAQPLVSFPAAISGQVLLRTAEVELVNTKTGKAFKARAFLDPGSMSSMITESMVELMGITCDPGLTTISGINNLKLEVSKQCGIRVKSLVNKSHVDVTCLVVPQVTNMLPGAPVDTSLFSIPSTFVLADPNYYRPSEVHILLGEDVCNEIICQKRVSLGHRMPTLTESILGWLVSGPTGKVKTTTSNVTCNFTQEIRQDLAKFWELEDIPPSPSRKSLSKEEEMCEAHFVENTVRLPDGRFSVKIPLLESPEKTLGNSYYIAKKRFFSLEKKLHKNNRKEEYSQFLKRV
ncbi:putative peptidase (DUF1758) domain-containing protein [Phthorimaea operculella]|nr:putative peptidase (DUF1758) domain-containing protein [Phthorimaea operculella]